MITNHLNTFNTLLVNLESIEVKFDSEDKAVTLLWSLPESWDDFVTSKVLVHQKPLNLMMLLELCYLKKPGKGQI